MNATAITEEQNVKEFVTQWEKAINEKNIIALSQMYSAKVNLYEKMLIREEIIRLKSSYFNKTPYYNQSSTLEYLHVYHYPNTPKSDSFFVTFNKIWTDRSTKNNSIGYLVVRREMGLGVL